MLNVPRFRRRLAQLSNPLAQFVPSWGALHHRLYRLLLKGGLVQIGVVQRGWCIGGVPPCVNNLPSVHITHGVACVQAGPMETSPLLEEHTSLGVASMAFVESCVLCGMVLQFILERCAQHGTKV